MLLFCIAEYQFEKILDTSCEYTDFQFGTANFAQATEECEMNEKCYAIQNRNCDENPKFQICVIPPYVKNGADLSYKRTKGVCIHEKQLDGMISLLKLFISK